MNKNDVQTALENNESVIVESVIKHIPIVFNVRGCCTEHRLTEDVMKDVEKHCNGEYNRCRIKGEMK